eukprot:191443-Chlamydomonas_euryale.AAC.8
MPSRYTCLACRTNSCTERRLSNETSGGCWYANDDIAENNACDRMIGSWAKYMGSQHVLL